MLKLLKLVRPAKKVQPEVTPPAPPSRPPLPGKLLAELIGLEAMRSRRLDDRRRRPRLDHASEISIIADLRTGQHALAARVRDMSAEGISLDLPVPLQPGTRFITSMARINSDAFVELTYAVRRCEPLPGGRHFIGGELIEYRA